MSSIKNQYFYKRSRAYLTVYFEIEYDGDTDDGEVEFELVLKNSKWMVLALPT